MKIKKLLLLLAMTCTIQVIAQLPLRLPTILSNHAVLQQSSNVKIWGWGPGAMTVSIVASWMNKDTISVPIGADCLWETSIKTPKAGGPYVISFTCGKQSLMIEDILVGEVWLCSGQSNMEFNANWGISDAGDVSANCNNKEIRFFQVQQNYDQYPLSDCKGEWKVCNATTMPDFSSVGYFFGHRLNDYLKKPVGLIGAYWGGTCIEAWMPKAAFGDNADLKTINSNIEPYGWAPKGATLLYNAMIHPIANYKLAGIIWYQGEANVANKPDDYGKLFGAMIKSWRTEFQANLPIYYVQIAPWNGYKEIKAALLREQQESCLSLPKTGMISVADLVNDVTNIHPQKKRAAGERLANLALKEQYAQTDLQPYSPRFNSLKVQKNKAIISITSIGKLVAKTKAIKNFQLAGNDRNFYPATATIDKSGKIVLIAKQVLVPVAVRYCFTNDAIPNLFDTNNLPLLPFRTDKW
jgi:sialate O-acetylesterase